MTTDRSKQSKPPKFLTLSSRLFKLSKLSLKSKLALQEKLKRRNLVTRWPRRVPRRMAPIFPGFHKSKTMDLYCCASKYASAFNNWNVSLFRVVYNPILELRNPEVLSRTPVERIKMLYAGALFIAGVFYFPYLVKVLGIKGYAPEGQIASMIGNILFRYGEPYKLRNYGFLVRKLEVIQKDWVRNYRMYQVSDADDNCITRAITRREHEKAELSEILKIAEEIPKVRDAVICDEETWKEVKKYAWENFEAWTAGIGIEDCDFDLFPFDYMNWTAQRPDECFKYLAPRHCVDPFMGLQARFELRKVGMGYIMSAGL